MNALSFPNLPTDSLYKFLTIFGLVILLTSFTIPIFSFKDTNNEKFNLTLLARSLEIKIKNENINFKSLDSMIKSADFQSWNLASPFYNEKYNSKKNPINNETAQFINSQYKATAISIANKNDSLVITKQQLDNLYKTEDIIIKYCNQGIFYGLFICLGGFILWFLNNQVYQDLLIKIQSGYSTTNSNSDNPISATETKKINRKRNEFLVQSVSKVLLIFLLLYIFLYYFLKLKLNDTFFHTQYFVIVDK